jgi:hypothetical protein
MDAIYRTVTSLFISLMSAIGIQAAPMTWQVQPMLDGRTVALTISTHPHASQSETLFIEQFDGLKPLLQSDGLAKFRLKREAGVFEFDGVLRRGAGGGTLEFAPSETFPIELVKRGFERPTRAEQFKMAWHDTGFALIDELAAQKYERPTIQRLVDAGDHGINRAYLRELAAAGYRVGTVDALIRFRDHGVSAEYIRDLAALGLKRLSVDDLVRGRDHGVGPEYVRDLRALGYVLTMEELVAARDHGVTPQYARKKAPEPIERLIAMHDRGL